ncbi:hypothetical protein Tco_1269509, partial [Tanacetum coccineum]
VPKVYMHRFWDSVYKYDAFYRFKMDKRKRFKLTLEIFKDIFKICPRVQGQDFDALPTEEEIVCISHGELLLLSLTKAYLERHLVLTSFVSLEYKSFREETQIYGAILPESLTSPEMKETKSYKSYLVSIEEPTRKSKKVKRPAKKSTKAPARGVVIRENSKMPLSKKKEKTHPSSSGAVKTVPSVTSEGTGVKPGVLDVTEEESSESKAESWGNNKDDNNNKQDSKSEGSDQENDSDDDKTHVTPSNRVPSD